MKKKMVLLITILSLTHSLLAATIAEFTQSMEKHSGYMNFYWDKTTGKIYMEVGDTVGDILYVNSLATGLGSNDIGLDRGQLGKKRLVKFIRTGPKVFLHQPNLNFRAISDNPLEVKAVEEAFASSILWGFKIVAETKGRMLINMTDFLLRDSHAIKQRLAKRKQGKYSADKSRSSIYLPRSKNFPDNTEFEVTLTMKGSKPGAYLRSVTPTAELITLRTHHSFIRLPDRHYTVRQFDPRTGQNFITYQDYATPLGTSITKRLLVRHRLEKKNPSAKLSEVIKPIIYYLDPGVPEPIRSALREGALWWDEAFESAGFKNAFRVEMLPPDADPMDVRFNTIQWVHRSTRGWSYGSSIIDPRTGEIIKGHVTLGSLRVRHDMLIAQGLISPFRVGNETADEIKEMALARLRQLSAHEVGHTLGLAHNFAASSDNRASVMDYPHPFVMLDKEGTLSLSNAYSVGIGDWDKLSIAYAYSAFSDSSEAQGLKNIIQAIADSGLEFITDQDSRAGSSAHPNASLWDNGKEPTAELIKVLNVRKLALKRFGKQSIKKGMPWSSLERVLTPVYLFHRFQTEAVAKLIGGINYNYRLRGDQPSAKAVTQVREVSPQEQKAALAALLRTIASDELAIPRNILRLMPPPAFGFNRDRESFKGGAGQVFDALSAAETAASHTLKLLLNPIRSVRLIQQKALNPDNIGVADVQHSIIAASWKKIIRQPYQAEVQRSINWAVLKQLFELAKTSKSTPQVRAITLGTLRDLQKWLKKRRGDASQKAMYVQAAEDIGHFLRTELKDMIPPTRPMPPGSPIG